MSEKWIISLEISVVLCLQIGDLDEIIREFDSESEVLGHAELFGVFNQFHMIKLTHGESHDHH